MTEDNDSQSPWKEVRIDRRTMLASVGTVGAVLASGGLLGGMVNSAHGMGNSVVDSVYGQQHKMKHCIATAVSDLRALAEPDPETVYYVKDPGQEGPFYYDAGDTTSADNIGTVLVSASGARFKRLYTGPVNVKWFAAKGDGTTDDTAAFTSALDAIRNGGGTVFVPNGTYLLRSALVLNDGMNLLGNLAKSKLVFELSGNTPSTTGVLILGSDLIVEGLNIDVKLTSTLHGLLGNNVTIGEFQSTTGYKNLHNIVIRDLLLTRQDTGVLNNALAISGDAHHVLVENIIVRGKNIIGIMAHWSGDNTGYTATVTYHPHDIEIRNVDIEDSQEAAVCPSASYNIKVTGLKANKVKAVYRAVGGDLADTRCYAGNGADHEDQRGKPQTGLVLENVFAENVTSQAIALSTIGGLTYNGVFYWHKNRQSSAMLRNIYVSGTDTSDAGVFIDRFFHVSAEHIRVKRYKGYSVEVFRAGNVQLSGLDLEDVNRGVYVNQSENVKVSDGFIRIIESNVRTDADAYSLRIEGTLKTGQLAAALHVGDTKVTLAAKIDSFEYGQRVEIQGAGYVQVTDYYVSTEATEFHIEPSPISANAGATVVADRVAREVDIVRCKLRNGRAGVFLPFHADGVTVADCEMDDMYYYGIYAGMSASLGLSNITAVRNRIIKSGINVTDPELASPVYTGQIIAQTVNIVIIRDNVLGDRKNDTAYTIQVAGSCSNAIVENNISLGVKSDADYAYVFQAQNDAARELGTNVFKANRLLGMGKLRSGGGESHELADYGNRIVRASQAPDSGSWLAGDIVYHADPSAGGHVGWVCTQEGMLTADSWSSATAYEPGDLVYTSGNNVYKCTTAGISGSTPPTHTGGIAANGTADFQYIGKLAVFKPFGSIDD